MRLNFNGNLARVGNVDVHAVSKVTQLDSGVIVGRDRYETLEDGSVDATLSHLSLVGIEEQLAIIVPCMNEEHFILEGVLRGIPNHCLVILVSNSNAENFKAESIILADICTTTQRNGIVVHQQDPGLACAFAGAGMWHITTAKADANSRNSTGRIGICNGKGEAMMIGVALAKIADKAFVGFIDADNFVPGAVHEYCKIYAAGLHHALHDSSSPSKSGDQPLVMVRLKWKSKPKIIDGKLVPQDSGRCSRIVNEWMNRLLMSVLGHESQYDILKTANAGEHAMSIDLAMRLQFATGYAVEPFQLIDAWERSGVLPLIPPGTPPRSDAHQIQFDNLPLGNRVKILQVETMNPHIHDFGKGEEHVLKMQSQGLGTIYHSKVMSQGLRDQLQAFMSKELMGIVGKDGIPQETCAYPPMEGMDWEAFQWTLNAKAETLRSVGDV